MTKHRSHSAAFKRQVAEAGKDRTASRIPGSVSVKSVPYLDQRVTRSAALLGEQPVAVVLHLVQPALSGGREGDKGWPTVLDKPAGGSRLGETRHNILRIWAAAWSLATSKSKRPGSTGVGRASLRKPLSFRLLLPRSLICNRDPMRTGRGA